MIFVCFFYCLVNTQLLFCAGLGVTIECKIESGEFKTRAAGKLDGKGEFKLHLPGEIVKDGKLEDCFAQLRNATGKPCSPCNGLEASKMVLKYTNNAKQVFSPAGKLKFSLATCTSAFLWPFFQYPSLHTLPQRPRPLPKFFPPPLSRITNPAPEADPPASFLTPQASVPAYTAPSPPQFYDQPSPAPPPTTVHKEPLPRPVPVSERPYPPPFPETPLPPPVRVAQEPLPPPVPIVEKPPPPHVPIFKKPPLSPSLPPAPVYGEPLPPPVPAFKKPYPPSLPVVEKPLPPPVPVSEEPLPPVPLLKKPIPPALPPVPIRKPAAPVQKPPQVYKNPLPPIPKPPGLPILPPLSRTPPKYFLHPKTAPCNANSPRSSQP